MSIYFPWHSLELQIPSCGSINLSYLKCISNNILQSQENCLQSNIQLCYPNKPPDRVSAILLWQIRSIQSFHCAAFTSPNGCIPIKGNEITKTHLKLIDINLHIKSFLLLSHLYLALSSDITWGKLLLETQISSSLYKYLIFINFPVEDCLCNTLFALETLISLSYGWNEFTLIYSVRNRITQPRFPLTLGARYKQLWVNVH